VTDIFREPKPAAGFYKSQCDPSEEVVLEPAFHWARGDESIGFTKAVFCSNCEHLKVYINDKLIAEADPDRQQFEHLRYAPFVVDAGSGLRHGWGDLRIEGYISGKKVIEKKMSGRGVDTNFAIVPDETTLSGDGADATRVVLRVTDEFGAIRPFANDSINFKLDGPAELIGDNPFSLIGGTGAIWIRAKEQSGTVTLTATHPVLGDQKLQFQILEATPEEA
jgi:beta-galactosidase